MRTRRNIGYGAVALAVALFSACPSPAGDAAARGDDADQQVSAINVTDEEIRGADGTVLLRIDAVPVDIRVNDTAEFGVAQRFTDASISPDGEWLAFVTTGAAHSGGWLVRTGERSPQPAAFQYGGTVRVGPWSDDARRVVFVQQGPAGDRQLRVAHRERLGATVEASSVPVRTPDHEQLRPEERNYENEQWRDGRLEFGMRNQRWLFNPETGQAQRQS